MENEAIALKLQETTDRSLRNEGRIKKLEGEHEVLNRLVTAVEVMATKQNTMGESVDRLEKKVDAIEEKPAQQWDKLVGAIIGAAAGAFAAWVLSGAPGL